MLKIKKDLIFKSYIIYIAVIFLLSNIAYGIEVSIKDHLRVPLLANGQRYRERLKRTLSGVIISRQPDMERYERGRLVIDWASHASGKLFQDLPLIGNELSLNDRALQTGVPIEELAVQVNIGRKIEPGERWWEERVGPVCAILDYDNSSAPGDTPISEVPQNLNAYIALIDSLAMVIVPTGRDYKTIENNLINPLRETLTKKGKIHLLQKIILIHDKGAGVSRFNQQGIRIAIKRPDIFPDKDRDNMAKSLINALFDTMQQIQSLQTSEWQEKIRESRIFALKELAQHQNDDDWINANSERPFKLHIIPPEYRGEKDKGWQEGFGDILIWNRGGMFVGELDYVNRDLGIGNHTGVIIDKVKKDLGGVSSDGEPICYDYGLTYAEFSRALKAATVKQQYDEVVALWFNDNRDKGRPLVIAVDDSRGGFDVFQLLFGEDVNYVRVYVGNKTDEIRDLEAANRLVRSNL